MTRRRRSASRALWLAVAATIFGIALVLFPLKGRAGAKDTRGAHRPSSAAPSAEPPAPVPPVPAEAAVVAPDAPVGDAVAVAAGEEDRTTIPIGKGLPVRVNVGAFFLEVGAFDDTKGEFECTTDLRLQWVDPRLAFPAKETLRGYREYLGKAAEEQLAKIWSPTVDVKNLLEVGPYVGRRLRVFHDGRVESITRTSGRYKASVDTEAFPFDRQRLALEYIVREITVDEVLLRFQKEDVVFSRVADDAKLAGWDLGIVDLSAGTIAGWNGDRYATTTATLFVDRQAVSSIAPVFIPLLASLLIPLLALWMNRATDEGFEVDAFELANMGIGGLFSVIALSFAIYSANPVIASSDNTVTRLFGLNYAMLALSLSIVVVFFRYELPKRWFGGHVQREAFLFLAWATPLLSLATSLAFLLIAAA